MSVLACVGGLVLLTILLMVVYNALVTVNLPISGIFYIPLNYASEPNGVIEVVVPSVPAGTDLQTWAGRPMVIYMGGTKNYTAVCSVVRPVANGPVYITSSTGSFPGVQLTLSPGWQPAGPSDSISITKAMQDIVSNKASK